MMDDLRKPICVLYNPFKGPMGENYEIPPDNNSHVDERGEGLHLERGAHDDEHVAALEVHLQALLGR